MAKEVIIASTIEATKEWSIGLGGLVKDEKTGKEVFKKVITVAFSRGRNIITEEEFEALKEQKKGFVKLLEKGDFSEPETNEIKHDAELEKVKESHASDLKKIEDKLKADKEKAVTAIKREMSTMKTDFEKKLKKSNEALIVSEKEVGKLKTEVAALKKGK